MISLNLLSPGELLTTTGARARGRRLAANLTQQGLADRAQVSLGTLKLFERTGRTSFETLVRIAFALGAEAEFATLFPPSAPQSIEDVIGRPPRQRGTRT
jgi:transcriptional regulator with XRE-family HTH domain